MLFLSRLDMEEKLLLEQSEKIKHTKKSEELAQPNLFKLEKVSFQRYNLFLTVK